ncbi:isochorismatase family protein [Actinokineospora sp. NBRC 105648]|uniref:isochorismatase family protein n=1 Tax=Actinokineospora sp. NBRC 105648 TaxID=3032206 RepID=UPI0024A1E6E9|nr:isochorismatase family protein [Actinokineospora sp. NBRC 105648]GLZ40758.1 hypothetical protein Acsp05_43820 [Actinokineospora sp. NBRC 105648]
MGLPTIAPYPMPTESELPKNRVEWTCDPDRAVLLVHDMQNHFLRAFETGASPVSELVGNITRLRDVCREQGIPVVFSAQPGGQTTDQRGLQLDMWGRGIGPDPADAEIVAPLTPAGSDLRMTKWRYNAFHRTELADVLGSRDQLIITGVYAHIGCLMTAADAFMRDIQPFLVADAVADFSAEDHAMALRWAAGRCATTLTAARLIDQLAGGPR